MSHDRSAARCDADLPHRQGHRRLDDCKRAVLICESEELPRQEFDGKRRLPRNPASSVPHGEDRLVEGVWHASIH
ncbi:hypothetical protein [Streptomyces sp. CT34]|uniref:hypothetical protein n=1 Tax=Streptomyces sp. CT34 TaxID=1553907 RepID=UPI000AE4E247|nr:hypothetical protein [Streptomyces sp. CT34]